MIFQYIPFADHNAMLDPPTVDITGRILEMLATYGYTRKDKRSRESHPVHLKEQESDGSWFGRWGVNYIYGTFLVLRGLEAIGCRSPRAADPAGRGVDPHGAEPRWRLGRDLRKLRRSQDPRRGPKHAIADSVGAPGPASCRRRSRPIPLRRECAGCLNANAQTAAGTSYRCGRASGASHGYGLSRGCSTLHITCIGSISRCWL